MHEDRNQHQSIAARLKAELDEACREDIAASREFDSIMNYIPSGIPQPDGSLRIRQASARVHVALEEHQRALNRYLDFTIRGVWPEHWE